MISFTKIRLSGLSSIDLPITDALPSDPYILKNADGLGPPEVDVFIAKTTQGGVYQGRQPQDREPVLRVGLNPDYRLGQTATELRQELYGLLTPSPANQLVTLSLIDSSLSDALIAKTDGYIKRIEIVPFSRDPEVQITMSCPKPYFRAPADISPAGPLDTSAPQVTNEGTAPAGFNLSVFLTADMGNWGLGHDVVDPFDLRFMNFVYPFLSGDNIVIETTPGIRDAKVIRSAVETNLLGYMTSDSTWLQLEGGLNSFYTESPNFTWDHFLYTPQYWGI